MSEPDWRDANRDEYSERCQKAVDRIEVFTERMPVHLRANGPDRQGRINRIRMLVSRGKMREGSGSDLCQLAEALEEIADALQASMNRKGPELYGIGDTEEPDGSEAGRGGLEG